MQSGYKHQPPFDAGHLPVSALHTLSYEQYGKRDGKPALFVHGGPGGSTSIDSTVFFDPSIYRVVIYDQRGSGKSTPSAEIRENTSQHLVADIETLRKHLQIPKWHLVFGGSWGSALSLMYAQAHPEMVGSLVLRGILTGREIELKFNRGAGGAAMIFPDTYEAFLEPLPLEDREDPVHGYVKLLRTSDGEVRKRAARAFSAWDLRRNQLSPPPNLWEKLDDDKWCIEKAVMESHYFDNRCFIEEGQLLWKESIDRIRHIPGTIVHGEYDITTSPKAAWDLHKAWPESKLCMIPLAGHAAKEPGIFDELLNACDKYALLE